MARGLRLRRGADAKASHEEAHLSVRDIGKRAASGAALLTAKGVVQQILGFASTIVVTRLLVPDQVGVFAIAATISSLLWMIGGGQGMAGALIRRETPPDRADLRAYVALQLVVMTALAAIVAVATIPFGIVGEVTAVMVAVGPITAFRGAGVVVMERQLLYQKLAMAEMVEMFSYYTLTIVTVAIGWGVWGLTFATVARVLVGTSMVAMLSPTGPVWPRFDWLRTKALLGIGVRVQAVEIVAALRDQILLIGSAAVGSIDLVALWSIVNRILQAPEMLIVALLRVSFPAMSRINASGADAGKMLKRFLPATAVAFGVLLAPFAAAAPVYVPLLLGQHWAQAGDVLPIVCFGLLVFVPFGIGAQSYLWAIGDAKAPLRGVIADGVLITAVSLPLIPRFGLYALAIGFVISAAVHAAILARAANRHAGIHSFALVRAPILAWIVATGLGLLCAEHAGPTLVRLFLSAGLSFGLFLAIVSVTNREILKTMAGYGLEWARGHGLRKGRPIPAATG